MAAYEGELSAVRILLDELERRRPDEPALWTPGPRRTEDEIAAFERRLGQPLPPGYRAYLLAIGDGGTVGYGTVASLDALAPDAAASRPFPLHGPWCDPTDDTAAYFQEVGIYEEYAERFYALPAGARPTDGTLRLGANDDHNLLLLVLAGPHAGELWIDSTGTDGGGVEPAAPAEFVARQRAALEERVAAVRQRDELAARVADGGAATWLAQLDDDARESACDELRDHARGLLRRASAGDEPDVALATTAAELLALTDTPAHAANAWIVARRWDELAALADRMRGVDDLPDLQRDTYAVLTVLAAALGGAPPARAPDAAEVRKIWQGSLAWRAVAALSPPALDAVVTQLHPLLALSLVSRARIAGPAPLLRGVVEQATRALLESRHPAELVNIDGIADACRADPALGAALADPLLDLLVAARKTDKPLDAFLAWAMPGRFDGAAAARAHARARLGLDAR